MGDQTLVETQGHSYARYGDDWFEVYDTGEGKVEFPRDESMMVEGEEVVYLLEALAGARRELEVARSGARDVREVAETVRHYCAANAGIYSDEARECLEGLDLWQCHPILGDEG